MAANKMDEILKHIPDLEEGWKEMEERFKKDPAEREMLFLKYREMLERERLKENLPEPEFTKAKRVESDSKVIMTANEAKSKFVYPNKLYARTNDNITLDISYAPQTLEAVEYTCTDAFIEKACDFFEENIEEEDCKIGSSEWTELRAEYKSLDSFIRAFVEYMEGEEV